MDLSTLIKYSRKNIALIVVVVLCCTFLAGTVKVLSDYTSYNEEKINIQNLQSEINTLSSQKSDFLAQKTNYDKDERYNFIKEIDSASLLKFTSVF
jgi:outer membrane murein-binding lipoprotein Lpp